MSEPVRPPEGLRAQVEHDLRPVKPLLPIGRRLALLVPAALLAWMAAPVLLGLRDDIGRVGPSLAWGASAVQLALALALILAALREAVPAQSVSRPAASFLLLSAAGLTIALALATNLVSPEREPRSETLASWRFCWTGEVLAGAPLLFVLLVLIARGLAVRPLLAGLLAAMGAGMAVDGGWRLYCNYSNPLHVVTSHAGAVAALAALGVAAGAVVARLQRAKTRPK